MIPWEKRPMEIQTLLNPAFCGELLLECIRVYNSRNGGMPFNLTFLILPIILHGDTRKTIPYVPKYLHIWIQNHSEILIDFPQRVRNMIPITLESISFILQTNSLLCDSSGTLYFNEKAKLKKIKHENSEVQDCVNKCNKLGKLLAKGGATANIFTMWGIQP